MKIKRVIVAFFILFFGFIISSQAQLRKIPSEVTAAFANQFPKAAQVSWKDNLTNFQANFQNGDTVMQVKYNNKGQWLETISKMPYDQLNDAIKDGFDKSKFNDWEILLVQKITSLNNEVLYRIEVRKNAFRKTYLYFNTKGQLQKDAPAL
ncbi:PepSY-like domain-containing protein [Hydrotalea sp.]|uniref:PepSY-like domain-containing protein n=1 Tax=Hydrotalea sp. TaxID=2881279 RepID=UPI003D13C1BD